MNRAVIFDLDGVIADTQQYHAHVESELLQRFDITIEPDRITKTYAGVSDEEMFANILARHGITGVDISILLAEKWERMKRLINEGVKPVPDAIDLITALKKSGFTLAVASGSPKIFITSVLNALGITNRFDAAVSAEEVQHGKPAPDIFLLAAKRLGVKPQETVVIEDGKSGMIGAKRAQMKSIGLVTDKKNGYPATLLITALNQMRVEDIRGL